MDNSSHQISTFGKVEGSLPDEHIAKLCSSLCVQDEAGLLMKCDLAFVAVI